MSRRSRVWLIGGTALAMAAAVWAFVIVDLEEERGQLVAAAAERVRTRVVVFADFVDSAFGLAALALQQLDAEPATPALVLPPDRLVVGDILDRTLATMPMFQRITVVDKNGDMVATAPAGGGDSVNVADRGYFAWHQKNVSAALHVSPPMVTGFDDMLVIPVSMRIEDRAGGFGGAVIGSLRPEYFRGFTRSLHVDSSLVALADGTVLVSEPTAAVKAARGPDVDSELVREWRDKAGSPGDDAPAPGSGIRRAVELPVPNGMAQIANYVPLLTFPGAVFARVDLTHELAPWRREAQVRMIGAAVFTLLLAVLAWAMIAGVRRDQKRVAALRAARDEADLARQRAEEAERNKSMFLAHTSHELRTPLNAIIGFSEILAREVFGPLDKRYREYSNDIHHSGQHLLSVVNNILDLSKVSAGRWELARERFTLDELLDDIGRLAGPEAELRGIELKRDVAPDVPALYTDRRAVRQILLNLVANGIKFTPAGGVVAVFAARQRDGGIIILVLDTGRGIEPSEIEKVLEPFSKVSNLVARRHAGTGLGLPLCRALVRVLGGEMTIASQPGEGTSVTVKLPLACVATGLADELDATAAE